MGSFSMKVEACLPRRVAFNTGDAHEPRRKSEGASSSHEANARRVRKRTLCEDGHVLNKGATVDNRSANLANRGMFAAAGCVVSHATRKNQDARADVQ